MKTGLSKRKTKKKAEKQQSRSNHDGRETKGLEPKENCVEGEKRPKKKKFKNEEKKQTTEWKQTKKNNGLSERGSEN